MKNLSSAELAAWLAEPARPKPLLLDVREPWEFQTCRLPDSLLVPIQQVPARLAEIDRQAEVVVVCHHGARSLQVAYFLSRQGYAKVHNLTGGVDAWARSVDPAMPVY
jgi:rhodanese-related sulfurtransferase